MGCIQQTLKDEQGLLLKDEEVEVGSRWWNLYLHQAGKEPRAVAPMEAEFGSPGWVFGIQNYTALPQGKYGPAALLDCHAQQRLERKGKALVSCTAAPGQAPGTHASWVPCPVAQF